MMVFFEALYANTFFCPEVSKVLVGGGPIRTNARNIALIANGAQRTAALALEWPNSKLGHRINSPI